MTFVLAFLADQSCLCGIGHIFFLRLLYRYMDDPSSTHLQNLYLIHVHLKLCLEVRALTDITLSSVLLWVCMIGNKKCISCIFLNYAFYM